MEPPLVIHIAVADYLVLIVMWLIITHAHMCRFSGQFSQCKLGNEFKPACDNGYGNIVQAQTSR